MVVQKILSTYKTTSKNCLDVKGLEKYKTIMMLAFVYVKYNIRTLLAKRSLKKLEEIKTINS